MRKRLIVMFLTIVFLCTGCAQAPVTSTITPVTANPDGWTYVGYFPYSAVNITVLKLKDGSYVAYYVGGQPGIYNWKKPGRAFSQDGLVWKDDPTWNGAGLGFAEMNGRYVLPHRKFLALKDGRYRAYMFSARDDGIVSYISNDGLNWTKESGIRYQRDNQDPLQQGAFTLSDFAPVYVADGSVRAYFEGQPTGTTMGGVGTVILSAVSKDDGLTFTRDPGVRIDSKDYGQVLNQGQGKQTWQTVDPSVIAIDGGYRIYAGTSINDISAFSSDGLEFKWDGPERGLLPLAGDDPCPVILPDGRVLLMDGAHQEEGSLSVAGGAPDNFDLAHMIIWDKLPFTMAVSKWDTSNMKATITINGTQGEKVTMKVGDGYGGSYFDPKTNEPVSNFNPSTYQINPVSGIIPFTATITRAEPPITSEGIGSKTGAENMITVLVTVQGKTAIAPIRGLSSQP